MFRDLMFVQLFMPRLPLGLALVLFSSYYTACRVVAMLPVPVAYKESAVREAWSKRACQTSSIVQATSAQVGNRGRASVKDLCQGICTQHHSSTARPAASAARPAHETAARECAMSHTEYLLLYGVPDDGSERSERLLQQRRGTWNCHIGTGDHGTGDHGRSDYGKGNNEEGDYGKLGKGDSAAQPSICMYQSKIRTLRMKPSPEAPFTECAGGYPATKRRKDRLPPTYEGATIHYPARGKKRFFDRAVRLYANARCTAEQHRKDIGARRDIGAFIAQTNGPTFRMYGYFMNAEAAYTALHSHVDSIEQGVHKDASRWSLLITHQIQMEVYVGYAQNRSWREKDGLVVNGRHGWKERPELLTQVVQLLLEYYMVHGEGEKD